jgi:hypothetical protein
MATLPFLGEGKASLGANRQPRLYRTAHVCFGGIYRVGIETTDKLNDPQIIAKVKEHCGIDR